MNRGWLTIDDPPGSETSRPARAVRLATALLATALLAGAAPPEVIRVHLPAGRVTTWFPAGTPLRTMSPEEFATLLDRARRGAERQGASTAPRLIRAHHHARWVDGVLIGRSELVAEASALGSANLELAPWTPIVTTRSPGEPSVGTLASGKPVLRLRSRGASAGDGTAAFSLDWKLRALPATGGRSFVLGLPGNETSLLTLELPSGWVPLGTQGFRQGPLPGPREGHQNWRFHGRPGRITLRLVRPEDRGPHPEAQVWVSGSTEVRLGPDVKQSAAGAGREIANWTTEWQISSGGEGSVRFSARLDPDLELLNVSGPDVREFRVKRGPAGTVASVTLVGGAGQPSLVRFEAHARVPVEGTWRIPAVTPLDANWTGGTTTVIPDAQHVIRDCRERAGVRLPSIAQGGEAAAASPDAVVFEASAPESVGDLVFRQPSGDRPCQVEGLLRIGKGAAPELECRLDGLAALATGDEVRVDLSPTWTPDHVGWEGGDESLAWRSSVQPDGSTRLRVLGSRTEAAQARRALVIRARSTTGGGRGPLVLPRVRPIGLTILDETWVALVEPDVVLHPVKADGLAWINPPRGESRPLVRSTSSPEPRVGLAWRWNAETAQATVECEDLDRGARVEIRAVGTLEDGDLQIDGELLAQPGAGGLTRLPITLGGGTTEASGWSFCLEDEGPSLPLKPMDGESRSRWGLGGSAAGYELTLPPGRDDRVRRIRFRSRLPWAGRGTVPLVSVPRAFFPRGAVLIRVPPQVYSQAEGAGLRRVGQPLAANLGGSWTIPGAAAGEASGRGKGAAQLAHAFTYTAPTAELTLRTEQLSAAGAAAVIREASLITQADPGGRTFNRLRLLAQGESLQALRLRLPQGTSILRVVVDGAATGASADPSGILVPLPGPGAGLRSWTIELDFERADRPLGAGSELRPIFPASELPCLAFSWELIAPTRWRAEPSGTGLIACDRALPEAWPLGRLGITDPRGQGPPRREPGPGDEVIRKLDAALAQVSADELTFGEWFIRWDSPTAPVVIDRPSLGTLGYGPRSPCIPVRVGPAGYSASLRTLRQYGLAVVPVDSALLITSLEEASRAEAVEGWRPEVDTALRWGSDRADRFQSVGRWSGEPTPREASAGVAGDSLRPPPGWSSWKFSGAGWPDARSGVVLRDPRARWLPGWVVAAACFVGLLWHRSGSGRRALLLPLAGVALAMLLELWQGDRCGSLSAGLFLGCVLGMLGRLGRQRISLRRPGPAGRPGGEAHRRSSIRPILVRATALAPLMLLAGREHAGGLHGQEVQGSTSRPIIVLVPFEGVYDPSAAPRRLVVREGDYRALEELARPPLAASDPPLVLLDADHGVSWTEDRQIEVTSELLLDATSSSSASWSVPIAGSREIAATVDGQQAPVFIEPGGVLAEIPIPAAGNHRLRIRRIATPVRAGETESLSVPVNPGVSARLIVGPHPRNLPLGSINARGDLKAGSDSSVSAELGPVDRLELSWGDTRRPDAGPEGSGTIADSVQLWDIEPGGDLVRARLSYRGSRPLSSLRFEAEPGLIPRRLDVPGLVAATWDGPAERPTWTLRIDPPLLAPATVELEMWRPLAPDRATPPGPEPAADGRPREAVRRLPRLEPLDVARGSGLLGVRRPGHWTGRQAPIRGSEPLSDENFVRVWGPLPDDRLPLAGTTRFERDSRPEFRTGPSEPRLKVRPTLQLTLEQGRVDVQFDADLEDSGDAPSVLKLTVPERLVVTTVRSEGLTDWSRSAAGELRLRYDRSLARSRRQLRLAGYIPVPTEPLKPGGRANQSPTPGSPSRAWTCSRGCSPSARGPGSSWSTPRD
ncbi:MAG: hypothetical protein U0790_05935 [Isosphaeraceae bacterium]